MTGAEPVAVGRKQTAGHVFVSYASANQKKALALCKSLEERGLACWISCRDVRPGENYQESIVGAIESARAMVLAFSRAANSSDEIKKELSLASRNRIPVIAARIDKAKPTNAFAYELSTRQWVDAFSGWEGAMDTIAASVDQHSSQSGPTTSISRQVRRPLSIALGVAFLLAVAIAAWSWFKPGRASAGVPQVRLADFKGISADLPATMPETMREELISAFGEDSIVHLSTATAPPPGDEPAFALSGTIRRDGDVVKVIFRLTNERTGTIIWTKDFVRDVSQIGRIPRRVAIDTSMTVRCGLFGASTYPDTLPEAALSDYFQYCQNAGDEPEKALDFARKVVAAIPDFSWGWSAIEIAAFNAILQRPPPERAARFRAEALHAADKAIKLDSSNSEAFAFKSHLIPEADLVTREKLLQQANHARTLPCGCEHHFYGDFLIEVGRVNDAVTEYRRAIEIMALNANSQMSLAQAYLAMNRPDLAKQNLDAAFELDDNPQFIAAARASLAPVTGDYAEGLHLITDPEHGAPPPVRPALSSAFSALVAKDPAAKARAVAALKSLPPQARGGMYVNLLGALGAQRDALDGVVAAALDGKRSGVRSWLFISGRQDALRDPSFPTVAEKLGLMAYWRSTHTRPDICQKANPPRFCTII